MTRQLTNSSAKTFRRCQREYKHRYVDGFAPVGRNLELVVGSAAHLGLEVWHCAHRDGYPSPLTVAIKAAARVDGLDDFEAARVEAMLVGYDARWSVEPYEVVAVELPFAYPMPNPDEGDPPGDWIEAGKIDAIVRQNGTLWVVEHKTSSEQVGPGSDYRERLVLDSQVSVYIHAARQLGFDVAGCIYDVLVKPELRPLKATPIESRQYTKPTKKDPIPRLYAHQREEDETVDEFYQRCVNKIAETPEQHYQRFVIPRLADEMREAALDRWYTAGAIDDAAALDRWIRNVDACVRYGRRRCPFSEVCQRAASLDDPTRFERLQDVHPELST